MARQVTIITPENIALTLEEAGLATRFGALLLDMLLQIGITLAGAIALALILAVFSVTPAGSVLIAIGSIAFFLIWFGYFAFFETIWNGQTPGKRAFGLRVMRDGGYPLDFFAAATRNFVRIADFLPLFYTGGALVVFFHPEYKRLGDLVAGTVVIKERMVDPRTAFRTGPVGPAAALTAQTLPQEVRDPLEALTEGELLLLRRFALRRWEMTADDAERLAYRLVVPLIGRLNLRFNVGPTPRYADLVSALVTAADRREAEMEAAARSR